MKAIQRLSLANLGFGLITLFMSALVWFEAGKLRPSPYDPLGSGAFPRMVSVGLGILSVILIARVLLGRSVGDSDTSLIAGFDGAETEHRRRPQLALGVLGALVVYICVLSFTSIGFLWATIVFVAVIGFAMSARRPRDAAIALAVGVGVGVGLNFVFSRVLVVALP